MNAVFRKTFLFPLAALGLSACQSQQACSISRIGPLTVLNSTGSPEIQVTVNGKPAALVVDTGAEFSMISEKGARDYGLTYTGAEVNVRGVTGVTSSSVMRAEKIGLGDATAADVVFVSEASSHESRNGVPVIGLFGADFLQNYDVKFDLPHHRVTLYRMEGCSAKDIVWPRPVDQVPLSKRDGGKMDVPLAVNGKKIDTILDSGAFWTLIRQSQAAKAGVTRAMLMQDPPLRVGGVDGAQTTAHIHTFDTVTLGDQEYHHVPLTVAPTETDIALLGADFLRQVTAWLSYHDRTLYIERRAEKSAAGW